MVPPAPLLGRSGYCSCIVASWASFPIGAAARDNLRRRQHQLEHREGDSARIIVGLTADTTLRMLNPREDDRFALETAARSGHHRGR